MEADVDVAVALGLARDSPSPPGAGSALLLHAERHHQRVAAEGRRARAALEIVGHDDAGAARLGEMHVAVDAARQHQLARASITSSAAAQVVAERGDLAAAMPTSHTTVSLAVATRPPRMIVSSLLMCNTRI